MLFFKNEVNGQDKEYETYHMVKAEGFGFEQQQGKDHEYRKGYHLLDDFELNERERPAKSLVTDPVGRHLETIFKKGNPPA